MDELTIKKLRGFLEGATCIEMENLGSYLQLSFGSFKLIVGATWKLSERDEVIISSDSDEATLEKFPNTLLNRTVQNATVYGDFNDLILMFDKEIMLEVSGDSESYEHWNVLVNTQEMIIAGPGKLWSSF